MAGKQGVDPRFDPRFQRGFEGKVAPVVPAQAPPTPRVAAPPAESVVAAEPAVDAAIPVVDPAPVVDLAVAQLEPLRRFNPFRLALLVASLAALAIAAWLMWVTYDNLNFYYGGGLDRWMQFLAQLVSSLPAPLITAGLLGIVLWLAVGIVAPRRRRELE
jgi:hypothetical protein